MLVAETGEVHRDGGVPTQDFMHQAIAQLPGREVARINHGIRDLA